MAKKKRKVKINYRKLTTIMQRKLVVAFAFIALCLVLLSIVLISINNKQGKNYTKYVLENQTYEIKTIPYVRGQILDRNNLVLAYSPKVYNLIIDSVLMNSKNGEKIEPTLAALEKYFEKINIENVRNVVTFEKNRRYYRALVGLTEEEIKEFKAILADKKNNPNIAGVWFEEDYTREYPFSDFASDVIGFTNKSGVGQIGLEMYYNDILSGTNGVISGYVNENLDMETTQVDAVDGNTIVTTIDYYIQSVVEKYVKEYNEQYGSISTGVIVQKPKTGEVLAMVDYPNFDLNNPRDLSGLFTKEELDAMTDEDKTKKLYSVWNNLCISSTYEPGSVIKPFTVSSGLDEGTLKGDETFLCDGREYVAGHSIACSLGWGHGELTLQQAVAVSCNDCLMQIAAKEGVLQLSKYQCIYGFGQKTGIDLPGEERGLIYTADKMTDVDLYTNSFGQNLNTTMIQVSTAFCSLINGGNYYKPQLLKSVLNAQGELITETEPELLRKTISESSSKTVCQYMKSVVEGGTGKSVKIPGYSIGGKTGTSEKLPRDEDKYVISFIGFAPVEDPEVVVYVVVDEPQEADQSHASAARVIAKNVFTDILPYLNIEKDVVEEK